MKKKLDHQTYEALIRRAKTCQPHGNFTLPAQVADVEWARYLCEVVDFMGSVARTTSDPFDVVVKQGKPTIKSSKVGQTMLSLLRAARASMESYIHLYELDPRLNLFVQESDRRNLWSDVRVSMNHPGDLGLLRDVDLLNGGFRSMKKIMSSARFKDELNVVLVKARKGYEELCDFFLQLVHRYPYACEILMDFGYAAGHALNMQCSAETDLLVNFHRKALEEFLQHHLGEKLIGYVWRRDYGIGKGHQINLVLLATQVSLHEHSVIVNELWRAWCGSITQGGGVSSVRYAVPQLSGIDMWQTGGCRSDSPLRETLRLEAVAMELTQPLQGLKSNGSGSLSGRHSRWSGV